MKTNTKFFKQLAIIGSTASGKTALSIQLAKQSNAHILSLDSLAIYKEIDIVSAKPTVEERDGIKHFGLDYKYPDDLMSILLLLYTMKYWHHVKKKRKILLLWVGLVFTLKCSLMVSVLCLK